MARGLLLRVWLLLLLLLVRALWLSLLPRLMWLALVAVSLHLLWLQDLLQVLKGNLQLILLLLPQLPGTSFPALHKHMCHAMAMRKAVRQVLQIPVVSRWLNPRHHRVDARQCCRCCAQLVVPPNELCNHFNIPGIPSCSKYCQSQPPPHKSRRRLAQQHPYGAHGLLNHLEGSRDLKGAHLELLLLHSGHCSSHGFGCPVHQQPYLCSAGCQVCAALHCRCNSCYVLPQLCAYGLDHAVNCLSCLEALPWVADAR
jgi:hypothetical protein